jgi:hypothetical protein
MLPGLPADLWQMNGLMDQRVTAFPEQELLFVRTGTFGGTGVAIADGSSWELPVYKKLLAAVTDGEPKRTTPVEDPAQERPDPDFGFQTALLEPEKYAAPFVLPPLPAAGPERARALRLRLAHQRVSRRGVVSVRATCPARAVRACAGEATLTGAPAQRYALEPGRTALLRFALKRPPRRAPRTVVARAVNADAGPGTPAAVDLRVLPPAAAKRR